MSRNAPFTLGRPGMPHRRQAQPGLSNATESLEMRATLSLMGSWGPLGLPTPREAGATCQLLTAVLEGKFPVSCSWPATSLAVLLGPATLIPND